MKRSLEIYGNNRLQNHSSSSRTLPGVGKFVHRTRPSVPRETKDTNKLKKVRFADPDTVFPLSHKPDASSMPAEVIHVPRTENPKTSEYAYFKTLKENVGQGYHSYTLHKHDNQVKNSEASNCTGEMTNVDKQSCQKLRSFSIPKVAPISLSSSISALCASKDSAYNRAEMENMDKQSFGVLNSIPFQEVTSIDLRTSVSPFCAPENSGLQNGYEEVFSRKRYKLHQLVVDSLSFEPDAHLSRYDLASVLLRRLVSDNNESNILSEPRSSGIELHNKTESLVSPELDIHFDNFFRTSTRNIEEPVPGKYLEGASPAFWHNCSKDSALSTWDSRDSFSTVCAGEVHNQCQRELDSVLGGGNVTGFHTQSASASGINHGTEISLENYEPLVLHRLPKIFSVDCLDHTRLFSHCNFQQQSLDPIYSPNGIYLDGIHDLNNDPLERYQCTPLIGWDGDSMQNEQELSHTSPDSLLNLDASWPHHWQSLETKLDSSGLFSSSFFAIHRKQNLMSLLDFNSESNINHDIGTQVLGDKYCLATELDHFWLTLSCITNNNAPSEICKFTRSCKESNLFNSPHYHHGSVSKIFNKNCHHSLELLSSALDFDLDCKSSPVADFCGEIQSSTNSDFQFSGKETVSSYQLAEDEIKRCLDDSIYKTTRKNFLNDVLNIHNLSTLGFQISVNKDCVCPTLFDTSSWNFSEREETSGNDSEGNYC